VKKGITILLVAVIVLSLLGCSADVAETTGTAENGVFRVGYSRVDINPTEPVDLGNGRFATKILEPIFGTCTAVTDETGNTVLLLATDLQRASDTYVNGARRLISQATGVPESQIYISASHTHSSVFVDSATMPSVAKYDTQLILWLVQAAEEAMADRMPAELYYGSVETENMNFVRHYKYLDANGKTQYFGSNFGKETINNTTSHATDADPTLHLIRFAREGAKDVVMANFRAHPTISQGNHISSDWVGSWRTSLELQYDCRFVFFQGAGGNVNSSSKLADEKRTTDYNEYGAIMADYSLECLSNMTKAENTRIRTAQTMLEAKVYHETDSLYEAALGLTGDSFKENSFGIRSKHHASHIIDRYRRGETEQLELNAVAIGNAVAFVTAPDELFDTNIVELEAQSPFAMNFALTLTNGHMGYLPSLIAWEYTCYETDVTTYVPGTAEQVRDAFLSMLDQMAGK